MSQYQPIPTPNSPPPSFRSSDSRENLHSSGQDEDPLMAAFESADDDYYDAPESDINDDRVLTSPNEVSSVLAFDPLQEPALSTNTTNPRQSIAVNSPHRSLLSRLMFWKKPDARPVTYGLGSENDGVFNNLMAKPDGAEQIVEDENPPSYEEAAADATPPYWETTILATDFNNEVFIDGLPVGTFVNFIWNLMVSVAFQFVGFLLTYLLHTSHAAKNGSRAGLGITFFQFGYYMLPPSSNTNGSTTKTEPQNPSSYDVSSSSDSYSQGNVDDYHSNTNYDQGNNDSDDSSNTFLANGLMIAGGLIVALAIFDYIRARRMEKIILQSPGSAGVTTMYPDYSEEEERGDERV